MASYANRVKEDIAGWSRKGFIDARTAEVLAHDVDMQRGGGFSFGSVLAVMAAILIGAAILIFVAANWEAIPRTTRVGALFAVIIASYLGGAVVKSRGQTGFGEALWLVGAAAFGGSIALISQMYHISGDETQALLVWCVGTVLAAALLRSAVLTSASVCIAVAWLLSREWSGGEAHPPGFLLLGAAIWAVSYWTGGRAARHLLVLSAILYVFLIGVDGYPVEVGALLALISAAVFAAAHWAPQAVERFARLDGPYPAHPLIGFMVGILLMQMQFYDRFGPMLLATGVAFAGIVAALVLRGRQSRLMRWIAYAAFGVELFIAYVVTIGTMMDTAGLFLFSGFALAVVAYLIMRLERRLGGPDLARGGAA